MIYLLEDDQSIRKFVIYALRQKGMEAEGFDLPSQLYAAMEKRKPDLLLLDIMLPEEDGITVLSKVRQNVQTRDLPVIMLTARDSEYDRVLGLDSGADDYIPKPFGTMELVSRIKALLRRTSANRPVFYSEELSVDTESHVVSVKGEEITVTVKEYDLLSKKKKKRGSVLSRDDLLKSIWGYSYDGENRTVDVHIRTLRTKLKSAGRLIETVRGFGYKIR